jgi:16S rRNA C967 or C1407 C5-methylase (RsmB/RsmF family)
MARPSAPVPIPAALQDRLRTQLGTEAEALLAALDTPVPVSIRLNPAKPVDLGGTAIPWCATGRYLAERPVFTLDPLLHAGCYYVQEAASMLLEQAFAASGLAGHDIAALDLCAAPGGKSTHLAALLTPGSLLVSNEVERKRQPALLENVWKWGRMGHVVTGDTPERFAALGPLFDLIVVDAPCSGEGMMRKDPFAREQWSPKLVARCAATQHAILDQAWSALAPGGTLIYSTCTWSSDEDDGALEHLLALGALPVALPDLSAFGAVRTAHGAVAYPHRVTGEGFFIGLVRKPGERRPREPRANAPDRIAHQGIVHRVQPVWAQQVALLCATVRTLAAGTPWSAVGPDGGEVPQAAAAYTGTVLEHAADLPVERAQALSFLRGEALRLGDAPAGSWRRITYAGHGLGFVRGAGNRWNNLLPAGWRIRMR